MTAYAPFHSTELDPCLEESFSLADEEWNYEPFAPGWYVCPSIPEGAIIDHRIRGPFDTTAEAFTVAARLELTEP